MEITAARSLVLPALTDVFNAGLDLAPLDLVEALR